METRTSRYKQEKIKNKTLKLVVSFLILVGLLSFAGVWIYNSNTISSREVESEINQVYMENKLASGVTSEKIRNLELYIDKYKGSDKEKYITRLETIEVLYEFQNKINSLYETPILNGDTFKITTPKEEITDSVQTELKNILSKIKGTYDDEFYKKIISEIKEPVELEETKSQEKTEDEIEIESTINKVKTGSLILGDKAKNELLAKINKLGTENKIKYLNELTTLGITETTINFEGKNYVETIDDGLDLGNKSYTEYINKGYSTFRVLPSEEGGEKPYYVIFEK